MNVVASGPMVIPIDGQLLPENVGAMPADAVLTSLAESLKLTGEETGGSGSLSLSVDFRGLSAYAPGLCLVRLPHNGHRRQMG